MVILRFGDGVRYLKYIYIKKISNYIQTSILYISTSTHKVLLNVYFKGQKVTAYFQLHCNFLALKNHHCLCPTAKKGKIW